MFKRHRNRSVERLVEPEMVIPATAKALGREAIVGSFRQANIAWVDAHMAFETLPLPEPQFKMRQRLEQLIRETEWLGQLLEDTRHSANIR